MLHLFSKKILSKCRLFAKKTELGVFSKMGLIAKFVQNNFPSINVFFKPKYMFFTNLVEIPSVILTLETLVNKLVNTVFLCFLHKNVLRAHLSRMGCIPNRTRFRSKLKRVVRVWDQNRGLFSNLFRIMSHPPTPYTNILTQKNCWCIFGKNRFCGLDAWGVYGHTDKKPQFLLNWWPAKNST